MLQSHNSFALFFTCEESCLNDFLFIACTSWSLLTSEPTALAENWRHICLASSRCIALSRQYSTAANLNFQSSERRNSGSLRSSEGSFHAFKRNTNRMVRVESSGHSPALSIYLSSFTDPFRYNRFTYHFKRTPFLLFN